MNRLLDKSYDFEFDKNENLTWYPWVGKLYKEGTRRILFVGDSHYSVDEMGDFDLECYDYYMSTKQTTREILSRFFKGEAWNFYRNLESTFAGSDRFWSKIAFYNFIQHPMKKVNAKPNEQDYITGWHCFMELIKVLKPTDCVFIGVRSETCFGYSCQEMNIKCSIEDMPVQINGIHPRKHNIVFSDGYTLDFYFIRHTSQYYSPEQWSEFLKQQLPEAMEWLYLKVSE